MPRHIVAASLCVLAALAAARPARADDTIMIYGLGLDAFCRDANAKLIDPRRTLSLPPPRAAEAAPNNLIKVKGQVKGKDCYFYRAETNLEPVAARCPHAEIANESSAISGTRDPNCGNN